MKATIGLYSRRGGGGHFNTFADNISRLLGMGNLVATRIKSSSEAVAWPGVLVVLDADYDRVGYSLLSLRRSARGLPTINMLWRTVGQEPSQNKKILKQVFYALASRIPLTRNLSVVSARLSGIYGDNEFVDSEYWDLLLPDRFTSSENDIGSDVSQAIELASRKRIVLAIGGLRRDKGAQFLIDAWIASPELRDRFSLIVAGIREDIVEHPHYEEIGALRIARRLSDAEWMALLRASSVVWACYAPSYDRSSGVAGRALQLAKWLTVRKGSLLEKEVGDSVRCLPIEFGNFESFSENLVATLRSHEDGAYYDAHRGQLHSLNALEISIGALGRKK